jgi:hypothetical protein
MAEQLCGLDGGGPYFDQILEARMLWWSIRNHQLDEAENDRQVIAQGMDFGASEYWFR